LADIGKADADTNPASADHAWKNGVWVANGNLAIRHLGVPTVTAPMGLTSDIGMPAGLTFAGRAGEDGRLLAFSAAFETLCPPPGLPPRTPPLPPVPHVAARPGQPPRLTLTPEGQGHRLETSAPPVWLSVAGQVVPPETRRIEAAPGALVLALYADGQACLAEVPL